MIALVQVNQWSRAARGLSFFYPSSAQLDALGIERPILVGHNFGGMLAAEMAAIEPRRVEKLVLMAPARLYFDDCPTTDFFAVTPPELVAAAFHDRESQVVESLNHHFVRGVLVLWHLQERAGFAAAAGFLWPLGDRALSERLYRIKAPTLLLWGESDRIIPTRYAVAFKEMLDNASRVKIEKIARAGHIGSVVLLVLWACLSHLLWV